MRKIIIVRGVHDTGKTTSINELYNWIISLDYQLIDNVTRNSNGDILGTITIGNLVIGFNSAGDKPKEVLKIEKLKDEHGNFPDIIICASRTKGKPYKYLRDNFNQSTNWLRIIQNKRRFNSTPERTQRDERTLAELKVRLIGIEKKG